MRSTPLACFLSLVALAAHGCSEPECASHEYRIADRCYRRKADAALPTDSSTSAVSSSDNPEAGLAASMDAALALPTLDGASSGASDAATEWARGDLEADASPTAPSCIPAPEICDAVDNDCDGVIDEEVKSRCWDDPDGDGFATADAVASELCGECGANRTAVAPTGMAIDCDGSSDKRSPSVTDICGDEIDNDCDGTADDDANNACGGPCTTQLAGKPGESCSNGLRGACARSGKYECRADKALHCSAEAATGMAELCNAIDDDCDGEIDEGVKNACDGCIALPAAPESACSVGQGECRATGVYKCDGPNAVACSAVARASSAEACDTKDNDCDGEVDEGVKNACGGCAALAQAPGSACSSGSGACAGSGTYQCSGSDAVTCNAAPVTAPIWYKDCDGDGYGVLEGSVQSCDMPAPSADCMAYVQQVPVAGSTLDCHDNEPTYHPGADYGIATIFPLALPDDDLNCDGVVEVTKESLVALDREGWSLGKFRLCVDSTQDAAIIGSCELSPCLRILTPDTLNSVACGTGKLVLTSSYTRRADGSGGTYCAVERHYSIPLCR